MLCIFHAAITGETFYVKHDVAKAIKTVINSASGGFREKAADLSRVSGVVALEALSVPTVRSAWALRR